MVDLFCGTKSVASVFEQYGFEVVTLDVDFGFKPDICADIRVFKTSRLREFKPDIVWASPPCEGFSVSTIGRNWHRDHTPKTDKARLALELARHTLRVISELEPRYYFIENPVGKLRKMSLMAGLPRRTVTYCQYGDSRMKPTDIWTNCEAWRSRPRCSPGAACHEAAPRGSKTGTQGLANKIERAKIPAQLIAEIVEAVLYE